MSRPSPTGSPSPPPSGTYLLSPGPGIRATLHVNPAATVRVVHADGSKGKPGQKVSVGSLLGATGAALQIEVESENGYADGQITIEYDTSKSAWCSIDFLLGHTTPWDVPTSSGQATSILHYDSTTPTNVAISVPAPGGGGSGVAESCQPLNPEMVFVVDYDEATGNVFVRGNCPLAPPKEAWGTQHIDFQAVHDILSTRFEEATGGAFHDLGAYVFNDVNLQGWVSEKLYLDWELASIGGQHLEVLANQAWYPTRAEDPYRDPKTGMLCRMVSYPVNPDAVAGSPLDAFDQGCAQHLSTWMSTPPGPTGLPNVYYVHCASGHDRTGIVSSSYLLSHYPSWSLDEAFIRGTTVHLLGSGSGQLQPVCSVIDGADKGKTSTRFSRVMMIAEVYNQTVENIYNTVRGTTATPSTLGAQATATNPAWVYSGFPWST